MSRHSTAAHNPELKMVVGSSEFVCDESDVCEPQVEVEGVGVTSSSDIEEADEPVEAADDNVGEFEVLVVVVVVVFAVVVASLGFCCWSFVNEVIVWLFEF